MLTEFLQYLIAERRYSPLTVRNYKRDILLFFDRLGVSEQIFDPTRITTEDLREWIIRRSEQGLAAATVNREVSSLRSFFHWLLRTGRIDRDVCARVGSLRTPKRLPSFVPESRMTGIIRECDAADTSFVDERNALIILLLYTCGIRLAELIGIDRSDFSDNFTSLRIRGKGDKQRIVPIIEFVREKTLHHLTRIDQQKICKPEEKALFLTSKGERISRSAVYRIVKTELAAAGVRGKQSPHVLRHTFATHLLNSGAGIREIQELLGHASLQATQVYTHNSITALKKAYAQAHPRGKRER